MRQRKLEARETKYKIDDEEGDKDRPERAAVRKAEI